METTSLTSRRATSAAGPACTSPSQDRSAPVRRSSSAPTRRTLPICDAMPASNRHNHGPRHPPTANEVEEPGRGYDRIPLSGHRPSVNDIVDRLHRAGEEGDGQCQEQHGAKEPQSECNPPRDRMIVQQRIRLESPVGRGLRSLSRDLLLHSFEIRSTPLGAAVRTPTVLAARTIRPVHRVVAMRQESTRRHGLRHTRTTGWFRLVPVRVTDQCRPVLLGHLPTPIAAPRDVRDETERNRQEVRDCSEHENRCHDLSTGDVVETDRHHCCVPEFHDPNTAGCQRKRRDQPDERERGQDCNPARSSWDTPT